MGLFIVNGYDMSFIVVVVGIITSALLHVLYVIWFADEFSGDPPLISPATLHRVTRMNWTGCIIYWTLGLALAPLFTITGIFAWLFTVGRKD